MIMMTTMLRQLPRRSPWLLFGAACWARVVWAEFAVPAGYVEPVPLPPCDFAQIDVVKECPGSTSSGLSWGEFATDLYEARSDLLLSGPAAATKSIHALLKGATSNFSESFSCSPAVRSAYFSLARALALQGRSRRALAMLHLGFIFVRDRGFSECTPWPVQGWDMMMAGKRLLAKVRRLDRESELVEVPSALRIPDLRVAIVTICAYADDAPVRRLCEENRQLYRAVHGYDVFFFTAADQIRPHKDAGMDVQDGKHKAFFWKVNAVKNVLETGLYDWVIWMDCDAFFMEAGRTIDSVIAMYAGNSTPSTSGEPPSGVEGEALSRILRAEPPVEVSLIIALDSTGINNGVWLLRNSPWSHEFLAKWWHSDILDGPGREHNCSDQSTMVHTLLEERAMDLDDSWDSVEGPIWPLEARIAAQEDLQSFHQATAESAMSRAWTDGDFIKHHPGCHYYLIPCQYLYEEAQGIFRSKVMSLNLAQGLGAEA